MTIKEINTNIPEGKLLVAALGVIKSYDLEVKNEVIFERVQLIADIAYSEEHPEIIISKLYKLAKDNFKK